eukprot:COSAG03_NODE_268_length_9661_cov_28.909433_9_plen_105_part_00
MPRQHRANGLHHAYPPRRTTARGARSVYAAEARRGVPWNLRFDFDTGTGTHAAQFESGGHTSGEGKKLKMRKLYHTGILLPALDPLPQNGSLQVQTVLPFTSMV